ncbi:MAG: 2-oxoacid:ferredoxin oxidoreductase subunit beta [Candidatus Eisenbacteria sp.]|nr:2-oxoacid:ferredoxin oxidoreductase subunit beta [Candidatus Eisenbacteria bacterium]
MTKFPHIWCSGCGHGIVLKALLRAIDRLELRKDNIVMVSGIGCSSRTPGYVDFNTLHTTHGRAIAFATGVKMAKPEMNVIVVTGDGDATAIGGNHLIHAARRNIDLTVVVFNNYIYGMTGGQGSPTTPRGMKASTLPFGNIEQPFDVCHLAAAAGAAYVARATAYQARLLDKFIERGIRRKGFALIEAMSPCPTSYGRKNRLGDGATMLRQLKETSVKITEAEKMTPEELVDKIVVGTFKDVDTPEYVEEYDRLIMAAAQRA